MRQLHRSFVLLLTVGLAWPGQANGVAVVAKSPRNANYRLEVRLQPEEKQLQGRQILRWRNIQSQATDELWFHLYWNAWRNDQSTWMREDEYRGRSDLGDEIQAEDWGWIEIDEARLLEDPGSPGMDLLPASRYVAPDDGNAADRTVWVVDLPTPVEPGAEIEVELVWRAKVPRTFARTGFRGDFYFLAHWFPKLGVFEPDGWNCHQYHAGTEYFSDFGNYEVAITLPERFVVGATGQRTGMEIHDDGTTTHRFEQADVHAFTWTASPDFIEVLDRFEEPELPPVDLRLLIQPEHRQQADRHLHATKAALRSYGTWYGPYPYAQLTIVDPAWGSGAGGMEYPTLFTAGTRLFNPFGGGSPEGVTVHEAGHQFWYGVVANNEFEHAWLDEGLNTFSTSRTMAETYGEEHYVRRFFQPPGTETRGFLPVLLKGFTYAGGPYGERLDSYRSLADIDVQATPSYLYFPSAGGALSYSKTALWLGTLENLLGWDRLQAGMKLFFERWQFAHPEPEDFFTALEEGSGEDLDWFIDEVFYSSERFDYAIESVATEPVALSGFSEDESGELILQQAEEATDLGKSGDSPVYRSEVVVRRLGSGVFPVEVLMRFEDGQERRIAWDGQARWQRWVEERPARLESAVVDPDRVLLLDTDRTNNSRLVETDSRRAVWKWTLRWMVWLQDYLGTVSFFG